MINILKLKINSWTKNVISSKYLPRPINMLRSETEQKRHSNCVNFNKSLQ